MTTTMIEYNNCSLVAVPDSASAPLPPLTGNTDITKPKKVKSQCDMQLCALGKTFGHIPNVPIFTQWDNRMQCSQAAVHRSPMAGIYGNGKDGVYSLVLSGSYQDDEDGGDVILYTGAGGRERWSNDNPPKRLRMGPQTMDQSWEESSNRALVVSFLTENPVRVIRSWRCGSRYGPLRGYRYDGLYKVAAYWTAKGKNGKKICRCRLERLPDQPPIPLRSFTVSVPRKRKERLVSGFPPSPLPVTDAPDCCFPGADERLNACNVGMGGSPHPPKQQQSETGVGSSELGTENGCSQPQPSAQLGFLGLDAAILLGHDTPSGAVAASEDEIARVTDDATLVQTEDDHADGMDCCGCTGGI